MLITTISSQNQITLPKAILTCLGLNSGDKLLVRTEENQIILESLGKSVVDQVAGSLKVAAHKRGVSYRKALKTTKRLAVQELIKNDL